VDAYSGRYIGDKLREDLRKRIEEIKRVYAKPPKRKEPPKKPPREGRRPPRDKGRRRPGKPAKGRRPPRGRRGGGRRR